MSHKAIYIIEGVTYRKCGWFGAQLESNERGLRVGDTRVILGYLFSVYTIEGLSYRPLFGLGAPRVTWAIYYENEYDPTTDQHGELIHKFYKKLEKAA